MNSFTKYILRTSELNNSPLPLMHMTKVDTFKNIILNSRKLEPRMCKKFGEELVYLFYGRPAYRVNSDIMPTSLLRHFPVCFLFKPGTVEFAKRVYPFDSGGFFLGLYNEFMQNMKINSFLVSRNPIQSIEYWFGNIPIPEMPSRTVSTFFENNKNYYLGIPRESLSVSSFEEVKSYHELIKLQRQSDFDDRRATVEVQIKEPITISSDTLYAIVLPEALLEDKVENTMAKWKVQPITYHIYRARPEHFTVAIIEKVWDFLEERNLI